MRTTSFNAERVSVEVGEYDVLIFFAHHPGPPVSYLMIQRSPDRARNQSGDIHFEWCGQGYGGYDVIAACHLTEHGVRIELKDEAAEDFDGHLRYEVRWSLRPDEYERVRTGLRRMFRRTSLLHDEA